MTFLRVATAALFSLASASQAAAQDITLTSHDGKVEVIGNLLGYDGEFYRIDTRFGALTVDGSGVTCTGPACPSLTDFVAEVRLSGASVMAENILPALLVAFARHEGWAAAPRHLEGGQFAYELTRPDRAAPLGRFVFTPTTTDQGFADQVSGKADIVMALREVRPTEQDSAIKAGLGDLSLARRSRIVALDALVPVVSPDNPIRQISPADLVRIFTGEITNWTSLGGPDAPIAVHLPDTDPSQALQDNLLTPVNASLPARINQHNRSSALVQAVARDPFAIGIASQAAVDTVRALPLTGGCGHALAATRQSIKTEDYPLTSPMFLYLPNRRLPRIARQFLSFAQSPEAQVAIRDAGFVDQAPELLSIDQQGHRLANAVASGGAEIGLDELQRIVGTLRAQSRLSLSFRFETGSSRPDAQSRANIQLLAQLVESGQFDTRRLTFIGFSDGDGSAQANAQIALLRAKTVRNAVLAAIEASISEKVELNVDGFGEAMPMACDDTEWGRKVNRRVEVWVQ